MDAPAKWHWSQICHVRVDMVRTISILSFDFNIDLDLEPTRRKLLHDTSAQNGEVILRTRSIHHSY